MFWANKFHLPLLRHELENLLSNAQKLFSDESMDPKGEIPEGYRLMFMNSFAEFARRIQWDIYFFFCNLCCIHPKLWFFIAFLILCFITHLFFIFSVVNHLELREISTSQFDLGSSLYAICDDCGLSEFLATGDHNSSDDAPWTVQGKNLNHRVVYAASEMGIGREDVSKFCEILNMAFS